MAILVNREGIDKKIRRNQVMRLRKGKKIKKQKMRKWINKR